MNPTTDAPATPALPPEAATILAAVDASTVLDEGMRAGLAACIRAAYTPAPLPKPDALKLPEASEDLEAALRAALAPSLGEREAWRLVDAYTEALWADASDDMRKQVLVMACHQRGRLEQATLALLWRHVHEGECSCPGLLDREMASHWAGWLPG